MGMFGYMFVNSLSLVIAVQRFCSLKRRSALFNMCRVRSGASGAGVRREAILDQQGGSTAGAA